MVFLNLFQQQFITLGILSFVFNYIKVADLKTCLVFAVFDSWVSLYDYDNISVFDKFDIIQRNLA